VIRAHDRAPRLDGGANLETSTVVIHRGETAGLGRRLHLEAEVLVVVVVVVSSKYVAFFFVNYHTIKQ